MSFDADWLSLRAPADAAARDPRLLTRAVASLDAVPRPLAVDLGAGTGATVRALAPHAPELRWRLVDNDPDLLAGAQARMPGVETVKADIADVAALPLAGTSLVTASALLDLCSADWLRALADRLVISNVPFYAALSYDGAMRWSPPLPDDAAVTEAFNRDMRRDKGLGPALGPEAAREAVRILRSAGLAVSTASSAWRLGADQAALQSALVDGIAEAAARAGFSEAGGWAQARRAACAGTYCVVGHVDLIAWPQGASAQSKITSESRP